MNNLRFVFYTHVPVEVFFTKYCYDCISDGLDYDPGDIGLTLGVTSIPYMFLNIYIFPYLVARFNLQKVTHFLYSTHCLYLFWWLEIIWVLNYMYIKFVSFYITKKLMHCI